MSPDQTTTTWTSTKVRRSFIDFFKDKGHTFVPSSPVVPHDDPTLLFTNAGMNQFKPIFLGQIPPGLGWEKLRRAVNSQKCIRAGGKHNDLDDVGKDTYHHTFFEMLGNWSFGDYFKDETIAWAMELLTEVFGLDKSRLYATYFGGDKAQGLDPDNEARDLWLRFLPENRVLACDMKDNFWEMGDTGPCGPCSEIHYDRIGGGRDASHLVNMNDPDVIELWNLVFIQFDRISPTELKSLPAKHVDTGMGLERLCSVLQDKSSNYDTDLFTPIFEAIQRETNAPHAYTGKLAADDADQVDMAYRVIADHIRTLAFAIADGAVPSNEGRGYVLRRVLRRGVRFGRQMLGSETGFFHKLVPTLVEIMGEAYPELRAKQDHIVEIIANEEESFARTLDRGIDRVSKEIVSQIMLSWNRDREGFVSVKLSPKVGLVVRLESDLSPRFVPVESITPELTRQISDSTMRANNPVFNGKVAFELYDTYGFSRDLTQQMAEERGLTVDVEGFNRCMAEQKERSRAAGKRPAETRLVLTTEAVANLIAQGIEPTQSHHRDEHTPISAKLKAIWNGTDFDLMAEGLGRSIHGIGLVFHRTNYYPEAGGQVADFGHVFTLDEDTKASRNRLVSRGDLPKGTVAGEFRVLHVQQFGPYILHIGHVVRGEIRVDDIVELRIDRARRDHIAANHTATHLLNLALRAEVGDTVDQKGSVVDPDRLRFDFSAKPVTDEQVGLIEQRVRDQIAQDQPVFTDTVPLAMAQKINTLRAVFGEKYPDPVRVVSIGVPIDQLLADHDCNEWMRHSVEFCGGTHLQHTGAASAFAIVSETGIAKGIRRMEALTGVPALAAIAAADAFDERLDESNAMDDAALAETLGELQGELDTLTMPIARKAQLRARIGGFQDRVKAARKIAAKAAAGQAIEQARAIAARAAESGDRIIVAQLDPPPEAGPNRQALQAALKAIAQANPDAAVMLISGGQDQVAVLASVPKSLIAQGLKAGDWVREAATTCGGKGGGRPDQAQGGGTDPSRINDAIQIAQRIARDALAPASS